MAFGDSITDGAGSTPGADNRYPDELAERLAAAGRPRGRAQRRDQRQHAAHRPPLLRR
ncbi:SGNH/GDSL hydrolase family protein [Sphaerisporangium fuscum]|uniref:SGNH/GDSL hydrolase family protein n=1 Tax=Sphaerisporangium fuscum TaxID=2835868 RepID=UPI003557A210